MLHHTLLPLRTLFHQSKRHMQKRWMSVTTENDLQSRLHHGSVVYISNEKEATLNDKDLVIVPSANLLSSMYTKLQNNCYALATAPIGDIVAAVDDIRRSHMQDPSRLLSSVKENQTICERIHQHRALHHELSHILKHILVEVDPNKVLKKHDRSTDSLPPTLLKAFQDVVKTKTVKKPYTALVSYHEWRTEWTLEGNKSLHAASAYLQKLVQRLKKSKDFDQRSISPPSASNSPSVKQQSGQVNILKRYKLSGAKNVFPPTRIDYLSLFEVTMLKPEHSINSSDRVLEVGVGTGILAIMLRLLGASKVVATDFSEAAVNCAKKNLSDVGLSKVRILQADIYPNSNNHQYDLIVCNPAWLPCSTPGSIAAATQDHQYATIQSLFRRASQGLLSSHGRIMLIFSNQHQLYACCAPSISEMASKYNMSAEIVATAPIDVKHDPDSPVFKYKKDEQIEVWKISLLNKSF